MTSNLQCPIWQGPCTCVLYEDMSILLQGGFPSSLKHSACCAASALAFLCRQQVASQDTPSPYEGAFPENIKS